MPIRVKCGNCKKTLSVKDHLAGKKIKCPVCQTVVAVPTASTPAKPASPSAAASPAKPPTTAKPAAKIKAPAEPGKTNGPPGADKTKSNGTPTAEPEPVIELPPENIEAEAMSAFADEPKPVEEEKEPEFIEFKCDWCDEQVKLPIDLAGKQAQCPNPECKRVVKVPLPKKVEKKDWRKMDRQGPAAALINQPEAPTDAWGTQDATKVRQASLEQAGAIDKPVGRPVGVIGWVFRAFYGLCLVAVLVAVVSVGTRLYSTKQQHNALKEAEDLVKGRNSKIQHPLLKAHAHRAIALLYLRDGKPQKAKEKFRAAVSYIDVPSEKNPAVNDQLFLIDAATSQIELGGSEQEFIAKTKIEWKDARDELSATLGKIAVPEVRVLAMRELGPRLIDLKQDQLAISLAATLSNSDDKKAPIAYRQQIALLCAIDQEAKIQGAKKPDGVKELPAALAHVRVGFAEGYARKGDYAGAIALAKVGGPARDKLDAFVGIAAVALQNNEKQRAAECVREAVNLARSKDKDIKDWHLLQLIRVAARADDAESAKAMIEGLSPPFKLRAQLEIFLAACAKAEGEAPVDALQDLETSDKEGITLALAWLALAEHNTLKGGSRERNRAIFEERAGSSELADKLRPMVDVGTYLATK